MVLFCETFTAETQQQAPTTQLQPKFFEKHKQQTHGRTYHNSLSPITQHLGGPAPALGSCWLPCTKPNLSCTFRQFPSSFHSLPDTAGFLWFTVCVSPQQRWGGGRQLLCVPWHLPLGQGGCGAAGFHCGLLDISLGGDGWGEMHTTQGTINMLWMQPLKLLNSEQVWKKQQLSKLQPGLFSAFSILICFTLRREIFFVRKVALF